MTNVHRGQSPNSFPMDVPIYSENDIARFMELLGRITVPINSGLEIFSLANDVFGKKRQEFINKSQHLANDQDDNVKEEVHGTGNGKKVRRKRSKINKKIDEKLVAKMEEGK
jgi:hypothetical protein